MSLRDLLDRQEIHDCLLRYCRGVDRHDTELAKSAYHEDARDDHAMYIGSGHGLVEWAERFHDEQFASHHHYLTNVTIDLDGDLAHVESYFLFTAVPHGTRNSAVGGGRYVDRFERRDGRWAIADRVCLVEWGYDDEALARLEPLRVHGAQDRTDPSYDRPLRVSRPDRQVGVSRFGTEPSRGQT